MLKFKEFINEYSLNEVFGEPYQWERQYFDGDGEVLYYFTLDDRRTGAVEMFVTDPGIWQVQFRVGGTTEATGKGDAFRIFATVIEILKDFVKFIGRENIKKLYFTAKGQSRIDLYKAVLKKFANKENFIFDEIGGVTNKRMFSMYNKEIDKHA